MRMIEQDYQLLLEREHLTTVLEEYVQMAPLETGGILMGYLLEKIFVITDIVGPGIKALHTQHTFIPDNDFHETEIARIYEVSGRRHTYLGDWHTHPGSAAYLSKRDKKTLQNISVFKESRLSEPLMLIFGTAPLELKCWIYRPSLFNDYQTVKIILTH